MSYHIDIVPNQTNKPAILFRQAWREGKRIRRKTLANLPCMPPEFIDALCALLKGAVIYPSMDALFRVRRALPHGHVAAILGTCRRIGLPSQPNRPFTWLAEATPLQQRALELLDVDLNPDVAISLTP